jgi:leucyl aminopeptidase
MTTFVYSEKAKSKQSAVYLFTKSDKLSSLPLSREEVSYAENKLKQDEKFIVINRFSHLILLQQIDDFENKSEGAKREKYRGLGAKVAQIINTHQYKEVWIGNHPSNTDAGIFIAEGAALANYQFLKYKSEKKPHTLTSVLVQTEKNKKAELNLAAVAVEEVLRARNWVNEPVSHLDAVEFAKQIKAEAKLAGVSCEVLNKKQIEALKMGGLLAVNKGSKTPPTFTILEYKPSKAKNKKPLILVGKGVVYDTGGLSLKPTASMDTMKCDMAGAAAVAAGIFAIAKSNLPLHVIALIPATDNRPGEIAYTPGDVIHMYDGQTVEVLNTDAEGRMILADALAYAKKYEPEMVLDFATLTGAASAAIGAYGIVCMGTASEEGKSTLKTAGELSHERLVEFPFWDDYAALIKSDIADMKNIGGPVAGAITAGKFLEKFVDYPWMHFDIAGPAFISSADTYKTKGGTGVGVRLILEWAKQLAAKKK